MMSSLDAIDSKQSLLTICLMMGGALVDQLGFTLSSIGFIFAGELMAMAISCAVCATLMPRIDRRTFVIFALLALIVVLYRSYEQAPARQA